MLRHPSVLESREPFTKKEATMPTGTNPAHIDDARTRLTKTYAAIFANTGLSWPTIQEIAASITFEEVNGVLLDP